MLGLLFGKVASPVTIRLRTATVAGASQSDQGGAPVICRITINIMSSGCHWQQLEKAVLRRLKG